uniref:Ig-like domain-containing protein n=1 Tax=Strigamia maritima TaxID=126957 RepID=T1JJS9_STRMM
MNDQLSTCQKLVRLDFTSMPLFPREYRPYLYKHSGYTAISCLHSLAFYFVVFADDTLVCCFLDSRVCKHCTREALARDFISGQTLHMLQFKTSETAGVQWEIKFLVSWIRKQDFHILTSGVHTYTNDQRFNPIHIDRADDWTLQIKFVQKKDEGVYECQVTWDHGIISIFLSVDGRAKSKAAGYIPQNNWGTS